MFTTLINKCIQSRSLWVLEPIRAFQYQQGTQKHLGQFNVGQKHIQTHLHTWLHVFKLRECTWWKHMSIQKEHLQTSSKSPQKYLHWPLSSATVLGTVTMGTSEFDSRCLPLSSEIRESTIGSLWVGRWQSLPTSVLRLISTKQLLVDVSKLACCAFLQA